ncbi:iron-siderophore ABC transporter substrate-binding protein [Cryobacterium tepidiphilum]|uniref:Iron-siderophore ABC transporter substrate-binding protein n=1 Tax=Cryobacterium tepidiphilum TaxID=2486026 RepID=A0A3M8LDI4_9MICO|nr:iron-siderophore ABC transporter substrate-binding protein [Cryobacterium tepidiphilum]RNE63603.1 iron-siderophore ABC transporter substrate-binding protein [Cryobacterium tepidiphilum]
MRTNRVRAVAALAAATVTALLLAGCSGTGGAEPAAPADTSASDNGAFPVTIESALGDAVIPSAPKKIVTIGWGSADTAIALGTTPVGMEAATWGGDKDQYFPWTRDAIEKAGDPLPTTFNVYPEIDVESVLALAPDLILAPQSGITADQYATLSKIAPTVAYPGEPWRTSWDDQITIIGKALGKSDKAADLIDGINNELGDAKAAHPEFTGTSFAYVYAAEPGTLSLYQAGDPRVDLISGLGLTMDEAVAAVPITKGTFSSTVGLERADVLNDVDVVFTWFNDAANQKTIEAQPLFAQIPAVKRGSYVPSVDNQLGMASSMITPYSVPWALDRYIPQIEDAVAKVAK